MHTFRICHNFRQLMNCRGYKIASYSSLLLTKCWWVCVFHLTRAHSCEYDSLA